MRCILLCVRVNEKRILIDGVKDLVNHVSCAADKTIISDFVEQFTSCGRHSDNKCIAAAAAAADEWRQRRPSDERHHWKLFLQVHSHVKNMPHR